MRAILLTLLAATAATAQPVTLAPGHPDLDTEAVVPQNQVFAVRQTEPETGVLGTVREDVRLADGVLSVVASTEVSMAGPPARDSTLIAWPSLTPVVHVHEAGGDRGEVAYGADAVSGTWGSPGSPIAFDLDRPVFAPAAVPYVVRALPLDRPGYEAAVPLFSAKDRFQEALLTVVGPETLTLDDGTELAVVAVDQKAGGGFTRGFAQRHFVDPATRELVRTTLSPMGVTIQIEPVPADVAETVRRIRARSAEPPVALVPGHPDLAVEAVTLADASLEMRYTLPDPQPLWSITETVMRDGETVTVAMAAQSAADPARTVRDTVRLAWPSLAPISHHRVVSSPDGDVTVALTFDGLRATGATARPDGSAAPLDVDLPGPVFGPRAVRTVVARALPFQAGYTATLPVFTASDRLGERTLTVVGQEEIETAEGTVSAWIIEEEGDGPVRRYAVHPETRDLLAITYSPSLGAVIETVPR